MPLECRYGRRVRRNSVSSPVSNSQSAVPARTWCAAPPKGISMTRHTTGAPTWGALGWKWKFAPGRPENHAALATIDFATAQLALLRTICTPWRFSAAAPRLRQVVDRHRNDSGTRTQFAITATGVTA